MDTEILLNKFDDFNNEENIIEPFTDNYYKLKKWLTTIGGQLEPPVSGQQLAEQFNNLYEELAPQFGYKTKEESKIYSPESNNGKLMIAVSEQILKWLSR